MRIIEEEEWMIMGSDGKNIILRDRRNDSCLLLLPVMLFVGTENPNGKIVRANQLRKTFPLSSDVSHSSLELRMRVRDFTSSELGDREVSERARTTEPM